MSVYSKGKVVYLQGDLTQSGVTENIVNSLSHSLQNITFGHDNSLRIDCGGVHSADWSGLQLLYVWMQCAKLRGVESELVNLTGGLQKTIHAMGLEHCFAGNLQPLKKQSLHTTAGTSNHCGNETACYRERR